VVGVVGLLVPEDNERATEIAGASDGWCDGPPACTFVEVILALDVGGGGNFTVFVCVFVLVFVLVLVFMFPPAVPGVGGAEGTEGTEAGINALLSVLLAAAFSIAFFSRSL
jgi:hypothetical protein